MWLCIAALPYQSLLSAGIDSLGKDWRSCVIQGQHGPFILTSWGKMFCLLTCLLTEAVGTDCISLVSVEKPCVLAAVVFSSFRVWHCQSCHCMICPAATTVDLQLLLFCILCVGPRISVQFFMVDGVWRVNSGGEVFADITVRILSDSSWIYHKTDRLQFASWCYLLCQHNAMPLCVEKHWIHVWFVSSVSSSDGDKKKKQKGKGTLEPSVGQPTKLATLKVLSSLTLHTRLMTVTFNDVRCSEWKSDQLWWTSENTTHTVH